MSLHLSQHAISELSVLLRRKRNSENFAPFQNFEVESEVNYFLPRKGKVSIKRLLLAN